MLEGYRMFTIHIKGIRITFMDFVPPFFADFEHEWADWERS